LTIFSKPFNPAATSKSCRIAYGKRIRRIRNEIGRIVNSLNFFVYFRDLPPICFVGEQIRFITDQGIAFTSEATAHFLEQLGATITFASGERPTNGLTNGLMERMNRALVAVSMNTWCSYVFSGPQWRATDAQIKVSSVLVNFYLTISI